MEPIVDIERVERKKCNNNIEATLIIKAGDIVASLRAGIVQFKSMFDIVDQLRKYQEELIIENKRYNPLRIYSWAQDGSTRHNVIELQRLKEETSICQIILRKWPKITAPTVEPAPKRGRGRPSGSGTRTEQLKVRCSPEVIEKLQALQASEFYKGKSQADILEHLILTNAAYLL